MSQNQDDENDLRQENQSISENSAFNASVGKLLERLFGPVADEVGQYLADGFRQWRWRRDNFKKVAELYEREKEARSIDDDSLVTVSEGDAYRLAEACSFEDDAVVQEMWAGLITSAIDPEKEGESTRAFVEILKAIGPIEAGLLLVLYQASHPPTRPAFPNINAAGAEEMSGFRQKVLDDYKKWANDLARLAIRVYRRFPENQREVAVQNLFRLRCIGLRTGRNLTENQTRSGLPFGVSGRDAAPTYESFAKVADYLESLIMAGSGTGSYKERPLSKPHPLMESLPEYRFALTRLGTTLLSLCMTNALEQNVIRESAK